MAIGYTSGKLTVTVRDIQTNGLDLTTLTDDLNKSWVQNWTSGTGANQQQIHWHDTVTLSSSGSLVLDLNTVALAGGAAHCNNGFGDCNFAKVKQLIIVVATVTSGYKLEVGAGDTPVPILKDEASDIVEVPAGGALVLTSPVDGFTVTAATADLLKINNPSAGSVTFDIFISGTGTVA